MKNGPESCAGSRIGARCASLVRDDDEGLEFVKNMAADDGNGLLVTDPIRRYASRVIVRGAACDIRQSPHERAAGDPEGRRELQILFGNGGNPGKIGVVLVPA